MKLVGLIIQLNSMGENAQLAQQEWKFIYVNKQTELLIFFIQLIQY
jgi:hypothetical protein